MRKRFSQLLAIQFIALFIFQSSYAQEDEFQTFTFLGPEEIELTADIYTAEDSSAAPLIILFHQYKSSRGEYREIAESLLYMGFNCLAVDTRCGAKDRWNNINNVTSATSDDLGRDFLSVYPDLIATLNYAVENQISENIIVWGSSFSASLVFKLASENPDKVIGLLSFSPGEYIQDNKGIVAEWAEQVKDIPVYISCGSGELESTKPIFNAVNVEDKNFDLPVKGNHGSSILIDDSRNWKPLKEFLRKFL